MYSEKCYPPISLICFSDMMKQKKYIKKREEDAIVATIKFQEESLACLNVSNTITFTLKYLKIYSELTIR